MHIKYPRQKGFFTWEELGCLAKALGYQRTLFYKNIPPEYHKEKIPGLEIKTLLTIMDMKAFHGDLHCTYNMHDAMYNSRVIAKALDMLSNKYLSLKDSQGTPATSGWLRFRHSTS
ncbi:hypothetical protein AC249_AIPGENE24849 [Exaiptasia diaphana]|nr:hypothetical protein AC249_AIPGENE24849 [Exaiptasia diaphana]